MDNEYKYIVSVSQDGDFILALDKDMVDGKEHAIELHDLLCKKFLESEGYKVNVIEVKESLRKLNL